MRSPILLLALSALAVSPASADPTAELRAQGPEALQRMLARHDAMAPGSERDELARAIDAVAAQRYATVSRLYWYTDFDEAQRAAAAQHRPILALRMLGRLDEELSCANSRLFRTLLYANAGVSSYLRDNFVLFWSSERPVPRVTIDFGDGRKLVRTTTGNSVHYVLDEHGRVVDALPGLYAPDVFRAELAKSAKLARRVGRLDARERVAAIRAHHDAELRRAATQLASAAGTRFVVGRRRLLGASELDASAVERAQRATISKMAMEVPDLGKIGIDAGAIPAGDVAAWAAIGQKTFGILGDDVAATPQQQAQTAPRPARPRLLDGQSLALVRRLYTAGPVQGAGDSFFAMLGRLEQNLVADTALDQLSLRPTIRARLVGVLDQPWTTLNTWVYANVFHTPASDPWLGLLPRTDFTGLPGDGVVMP